MQKVDCKDKEGTKQYRMNFINGLQTTQERRDKYKKIVNAGYPYWVAMRIRDWTQSHIKQFLEANDPKSYKQMVEWYKKNISKRKK